MNEEKLCEILNAHKRWILGENDGVRADLRGADLCDANLSGADLRRADLCGADLSGANLSCVNLSGAILNYANLIGADLYVANLSKADLSDADLCGANLRGADLFGADLSVANLSGANLSGANLSDADLSETKGLVSVIDFLKENFERTEDGYIAYKTFGSVYGPPESWKIESGSVIEETVNFDRCTECGSGINVAPLKWVQKNYPRKPIWKVLIRWEWLCGVCVPYMTDRKIRCERVELLGVVK